MTALTPLQFHWVDGPRPKDLLFRLQEIFYDVGNTNNEVKPTQLVLSEAKDVFTFQRVDQQGLPDETGDRKLLVRWNKAYNRKFSSERDMRYWAKWLLVLEETVNRVIYKSHEAQRMSKYKCAKKKFSKRQANQILLDLALTIGVAPWVLGSLGAPKGTISVPKRCEIEIRNTFSVFEYLDAKPIADNNDITCGGTIGGLQPGTAFSKLPRALIGVEMRLPPLAVVVCEHNNLDTIVQDMKGVGMGDWRNYLVVLTGGFADSATCHFLSYLAKHKMMSDVPFLFISDHDFFAFKIFLILKYGTRGSASTSNAQTCPKLQWIGPTQGDWHGIIESSADRWVGEQLRVYKRWTKEEQEEKRAKWIEESTATKDAKLERPKGSKVNQRDTKMLRDWTRLGLLEDEPDLQAACDLLRNQGHGKFRLSALSMFDSRALETYIDTAVGVVRNLLTVGNHIRLNDGLAAGVDTQKFNALPSSLRMSSPRRQLPTEQTALVDHLNGLYSSQ